MSIEYAQFGQFYDTSFYGSRGHSQDMISKVSPMPHSISEDLG